MHSPECLTFVFKKSYEVTVAGDFWTCHHFHSSQDFMSKNLDACSLNQSVMAQRQLKHSYLTCSHRRYRTKSIEVFLFVFFLLTVIDCWAIYANLTYLVEAGKSQRSFHWLTLSMGIKRAVKTCCVLWERGE